jgi:IclR family transcriptional regulator, KDG regulon repressor
LSQAVRAVERALDILLCFRKDSSSLSLTEIAEQVGMNKSTIHRLLATLESKHFIIRDKTTGMYQLGYLFIELASIKLSNLDLQHWAKPYLQELSDESGETVDLAVLDNGHVVYLQVVETSQRVKIAAAAGEQLPACCTASGKALLAYLPESQVQQILSQGLTQYTDKTLITPDALLKDLQATRGRGYAISEQEFENDISAVAAPILNTNHYPIAAIAIVGPSYRMPYERLVNLGLKLQETAETIAREVGLATLPIILPKLNYSYLVENNQ